MASSKGGYTEVVDGKTQLIVPIRDGATIREALEAVHTALSRYVGPRLRKGGYQDRHGAKTPRRYPAGKLIETSQNRIVYEMES